MFLFEGFLVTPLDSANTKPSLARPCVRMSSSRLRRRVVASLQHFPWAVTRNSAQERELTLRRPCVTLWPRRDTFCFPRFTPGLAYKDATSVARVSNCWLADSLLRGQR